MCQVTSRNFTVDIHTHILPEHIPNFREKFGYGGFITLDHHKSCSARMMKDGEFFREVEDNCWSPEARMKECGHHHVDVQVLSTVPVMFSYWAKPKDTLEVAQFLNDHIAEICDRYPHPVCWFRNAAHAGTGSSYTRTASLQRNRSEGRSDWNAYQRLEPRCARVISHF